MRDTSLEAYQELAMSGELHTKAAKVYAYLKNRSSSETRSQIAQGTGITINCVCGRVNELVKAGYLIEGMKTKCPVTGSQAYTLKAA